MKILGTLLASLLLLASTSWAVPITFTHHLSEEISGSITNISGTTNFTASEFTITATGDTSARQTDPSDPDVFFIDHLSAQIEIEGLPTFTILTPTRTFVDQSPDPLLHFFPLIGFGHAGATGAELFIQEDPVYSTYQLQSSIGPVFLDLGQINNWNTSPLNTNGGILIFNTNVGLESGDFTAVVQQTPATEPGLIGLLALGLLAVRRRSQNS
jgi:MYXO-CTERM domain-containing protein